MPHEPKMTPFYSRVHTSFTQTQQEQIKKGAEKYPEPFNPHSWTPKELLQHGLQEAVDLTTYLVGLYELLESQEKEIERLRSLVPKEKKPPYMDLDD
jgi:hypothetical protein